METLTSPKNVKILKGHEGAVYKIVFDEKNGRLYSAGGDGWLVEWEIRDSDHGRLLARVPDQVFSLAVTPEYYLMGSFQGNFYVLDREKKEILHQERCHKGGIFALHADEQFLYTFGGDGRLIQWDKFTFRKTKILPLAGKSLRTFALHPEKREIAVGSSDGSIYILSYPDLFLRRQIEDAHHPSVFALLYDQNRLLSGGRDAKIRVWDPLRTYELIASLDAHWYAVYDLLRTPDFVVSASRDKSVRWWNPSDMTPLGTIKWGEVENAHVHSVNTLAYDPDTRMVISGSDDRTIRLWQMIK